MAGYLNEDNQGEAEDFAAWQPSEQQLESEWASLMAKVPPEDLDAVQADWAQASAVDKKQMLWDVRQILREERSIISEEVKTELYGR